VEALVAPATNRRNASKTWSHLRTTSIVHASPAGRRDRAAPRPERVGACVRPE